MEEGKRFEDTISIHDLMSMPQKELMAKIYIQTLKTNGAVKDHEGRIDCLEKEDKHNVKTKIFTIGSTIIGFLIILFQVLNLVMK
jgi:hypothetical protein